MLCRHCTANLPDWRPFPLDAPGVYVRAGVLCGQCGVVLGPADVTARLVLKLAQLNQFGLAGGDALLRTPPVPSGPKDL